MIKRADTCFYQLGKFIWLPILILGEVFAWYIYPNSVENKDLFECWVRKSVGIPCPGCYGTRAFVYLFRGHVLISAILNPTVIYGILAYIHFMCLYYYRAHIKKSIDNKPIHIEYYCYVLIGVILFQWIVKLIFAFV